MVTMLCFSQLCGYIWLHLVTFGYKVREGH